jgi:HAE1 family hydrophobic/amphiphilic exporter-1
VLLTLLVVLSTGFFMGQLGKGFMPDEDEGRFLVSFKTPLGSTLAYTTSRLQEIEAVLAGYPEIAGMFSTIGTGATGRVNQGEIFVQLTPREERALHQVELIKRVRGALAVIGGMVSSTLLTLIVVPAVYSLVEQGVSRATQGRTG